MSRSHAGDAFINRLGSALALPFPSRQKTDANRQFLQKKETLISILVLIILLNFNRDTIKIRTPLVYPQVLLKARIDANTAVFRRIRVNSRAFLNIFGDEIQGSAMTFPGYRNFLNQIRTAFPRSRQTRRRIGSRVIRSSEIAGVESLETRTLLTATLVKDIHPTFGSFPEHFQDVNGTLFFTADDGVHGEELWKSDGTGAGTVFVKDINPGATGSNGFTTAPYMTNVNGILYFSADDGVHGVELWRSDGTEAGTYLVKDIVAGAVGATPEEMIDLNGKLYFIANDGINGKELWTSDGTAAGTVMLKDIRPGSFGAVDNSFFSSGLRKFNGKLFFAADDGTHGEELWSSDGTAAGTTMFTDLEGGIQPSWPDLFTESNGLLYFTAHTFVTGEELFQTDGTTAGTSLVKAITPGDSLGTITELVDVNGTLFFTIDDHTHGLEIWKTKGTAASTSLVKDINPGMGSGIFGIPTQLISLNNSLIFNANDGVNGRELWKSDGTEAGTVMIKDIETGGGSNPMNFISIGKYTYFQAFDINNGFQLWRTDGTTVGTQMLMTLDPTFNATMPVTTDHMQNVNGTLYFPANEFTHSTELWKWEETDQNHAPVMSIGGDPQLPPVFQGVPSNGMLVSDLIASMKPSGSITDVDQGAVQGIAVVGADTTHGIWQYSTNGGTTWLSLGNVMESNARLLASNSLTRIRFVPAAGYFGDANLIFVAWDQTTGTNGGTANASTRGGITAFSITEETATAMSVNRAPVLNANGAPALSSITLGGANNGTLIADLIASMAPAGSITDVDVQAVKGIAVIGANNLKGTWQYSLNSGNTWQDIGSASVNSARLLASNSTTRIRFVPNAATLGESGISFVAWDQTSGANGDSVAITATGGRTAFSNNKEIATIRVDGNHAPVIHPEGNPTLTAFSASETTTGSTISQLIASMTPQGSITDEDPGALQGIAIIGVNNTSGTWQYSLNSGTNWQAVGATSLTSALLLPSDTKTRLRFEPSQATFGGTVGITFVAWDQTSGTTGTKIPISSAAGVTPFSLGRENAFVTVSPNHAPVLNPNGNPTLPGFKNGATNNGVTVAQLIASMGPAGSITDVDAGALKGIAIIGVSKLLGRWEYSTDGGTNWHSILQASLDNALLLAAKPLNRIRLVPNTGYGGTYTFNFIAWDQTSGGDGTQVSAVINGGSSAFSSTKENATVTVTT